MRLLWTLNWFICGHSVYETGLPVRFFFGGGGKNVKKRPVHFANPRTVDIPPPKTAIWVKKLLDVSSTHEPSHKGASNYKSRTEELRNFSSLPVCFHVAEGSNHQSVHFPDANHTTYSVDTTLRAPEIRSPHAAMTVTTTPLHYQYSRHTHTHTRTHAH